MIGAHLANVGRHKASIVYAGVAETESAPFQRIVYFFEAASKADMIAFVENDPYTALYEHVEILEFQQRLTEAQHGPVERVHVSPELGEEQHHGQ